MKEREVLYNCDNCNREIHEDELYVSVNIAKKVFMICKFCCVVHDQRLVDEIETLKGGKQCQIT